MCTRPHIPLPDPATRFALRRIDPPSRLRRGFGGQARGGFNCELHREPSGAVAAAAEKSKSAMTEIAPGAHSSSTRQCSTHYSIALRKSGLDFGVVSQM